MYRHLQRIIAGALALAVTAPVAAQDPVAEPGSELEIFLATFGPGDAVWEKFGHNAIWIRDRTMNTTISFDYGRFDFDEPGFYTRFLRGRMLYQMGLADAADMASYYDAVDRTVWTQRLNLTSAQKLALREYLERNWQQNEGEYLYDYFRDNCSTRLRDALDHALGGALRATLSGVATGTTYRSHSLRLTAANAATYTGLMLGLGLPTDRLIDAWEESFIPMKLMEHLRAVRVTAAAGRTRPVVAEELTMSVSSREPPPESPPNRTLAYLITGLLLGVALIPVARRAPRSRRAALAAATAVSLWGSITGLFGLILSLLWLFTNHTAAYPNLNLLQANPLGLLLAFAAPFALAGRTPGRLARYAWPTAVVLVALSVLGLVIHLIPPLRQANLPLVALALPIHFAVLLSLYYKSRGGPSSVEDKSDGVSLRYAA